MRIPFLMGMLVVAALASTPTVAAWAAAAPVRAARATAARPEALPAPGTIAGRVSNATTGRPVSAASVQLIAIAAGGPEPLGETRTDAQGRFTFRGLPDGRYLVQAAHQGVSYAAHAVLSGGAPADIVVRVYEVASRLPLRVGLLGLAVDVREGYVRVSEVVHIQNPTQQTFLGEVILTLPAGARYVTFHEGLHTPRLEGTRITDRLIVRPGGHQVAYAYTVAGGGEVVLDRGVNWPVERLELFVTAPAEARSPRLQPGAAVTSEGRTFTRASGRAIPPGDLTLRVVGVPGARLWGAPVAAGLLAAMLVVGLVWALMRDPGGGVARPAQNP